MSQLVRKQVPLLAEGSLSKWAMITSAYVTLSGYHNLVDSNEELGVVINEHHNIG